MRCDTRPERKTVAKDAAATHDRAGATASDPADTAAHGPVLLWHGPPITRSDLAARDPLLRRADEPPPARRSP